MDLIPPNCGRGQQVFQTLSQCCQRWLDELFKLGPLSCQLHIPVLSQQAVDSKGQPVGIGRHLFFNPLQGGTQLVDSPLVAADVLPVVFLTDLCDEVVAHRPVKHFSTDAVGRTRQDGGPLSRQRQQG